MIKPTKVIILETHEEAEQPYHLVKEIYETTNIIKGKPIVTTTSRLVTKNIRKKGAKGKLTEAELKAKKDKELKEEQEHSKKLLEEAEVEKEEVKDTEVKPDPLKLKGKSQ